MFHFEGFGSFSRHLEPSHCASALTAYGILNMSPCIRAAVRTKPKTRNRVHMELSLAPKLCRYAVINRSGKAVFRQCMDACLASLILLREGLCVAGTPGKRKLINSYNMYMITRWIRYNLLSYTNTQIGKTVVR